MFLFVRKLSIRIFAGKKIVSKKSSQTFRKPNVDQTFPNVHAKNLVKVTRTGEVMGRKRPATLMKLSFKFHH